MAPYEDDLTIHHDTVVAGQDAVAHTKMLLCYAEMLR
jgi:hypothetical protein